MTLEELGRRAVACKHWRWMDGMLIQPLNSRTAVIEEEYIHDRGWSAKRRKWDDLHPDLSDPATIGCLLALVREAWGQDDMSAFRYKSRWCVEHTPEGSRCSAFYGETEAEALVSALKAAP